MKNRVKNKRYFLVLYITILFFPGLMIGQLDKIISKKETKTRWDPYPQTKLKIAPHAAGQLVAPADSKAGMMLSHVNGHDLDCNLRPSKDGELVLAHDVVSDHNFWGDLDRTRIPYDSARAEKIGDYDYSQYKEEFHIRFEDYLDYMKKEAPELILYAEVKDHNQIQQTKAVQKIIKYGLTDRVYLYAFSIKDKGYIRNSKGGDQIKVIMWVDQDEDLIDCSLAEGDLIAIAMESSIPDLERIVKKVAKAGLEVVVAGWHWAEDQTKMLHNTGLDITLLCNDTDNLVELSPFNTILKPIISYPKEDQTFVSGENIEIKTFVADNFDNYGKKRYSVTKVEFYANDVLIGADTTSPYILKKWKPKAGTYIIKAKVFDSGKTKFSNPLEITVKN